MLEILKPPSFKQTHTLSLFKHHRFPLSASNTIANQRTQPVSTVPSSIDQRYVLMLLLTTQSETDPVLQHFPQDVCHPDLLRHRRCREAC